MKEGGHLASIHSLAEMVLVTDLIKNHIHPLWLGLANMQDGEGPFQVNVKIKSYAHFHAYR